jgi:hypothetical protein
VRRAVLADLEKFNLSPNKSHDYKTLSGKNVVVNVPTVDQTVDPLVEQVVDVIVEPVVEHLEVASEKDVLPEQFSEEVLEDQDSKQNKKKANKVKKSK